MPGILLLGLLTSTLVKAQKAYQVRENDYAIEIEGTSNLHNWSMQTEGVSGKVLTMWGQNGLEGFKKVNLTVPVKNLESGKRIMNRKTYDVLEAEKHPRITFELISVSNWESSGSEFSGTATGTLKIAGKSRIMAVPFNGKILDDNTFRVKGSFALRMTEFGIDPPTAMLGTLKTGNEVTLDYQVTFNPLNNEVSLHP